MLPLLFACTYLFVDYGAMVSEIAQMALGKFPANEEFTLLKGAINIMAISVFAIVLALVTLIIVIPMAGRPERREGARFTSLRGVHIVVFLEEVLARGLLFWLPLYLSGYNIIVFYIFWILSNGVWALLHLTNYKEGERSLWLVLPQFIIGLFIESYAFLKFGFWVAYAIHLFYDFLVFSAIGHEELKSSFFRNLPSRASGIGLGALLIGVSSLSLSAFGSIVIQLPYIQWLDGNFVEEGVAMFTFIGFLLIMTNAISFICDLSGMDESSILNIIKQKEYGFLEKRIGWIALNVLVGLLAPIFLVIVYYLIVGIAIPILNFFTPFKNITNATFLLCAFVMSSVGSKDEKELTSPSAEFRSFLVGFPLYFLLFVYMAKVSILDFFLCSIVYFTLSGAIDSLRLY